VTERKRLIVNADDLGRTSGVNRGVFEAHRRGIVTSATLMVNYPAAAEVKSMARDHPQLGIGLHVALTGGPAALPAAELPSLIDAEGLLPAKPEGLEGADPGEILKEARAQLVRFRQVVGREPTHFDTHHHSHHQPAVLEALVTLAWETGLPVRSGSAAMRERLREEGIPTSDHFVEEFFADTATLENLIRILGALELGTTELMCHPAIVDDPLKAGSSYAEPRARELEALTHPEPRAAIQAAGIRLIHFGAL
jgi:chitin disaccharide deacetylase